MPHGALDVAKWILSEAKRQGIAMTHMKLQKLLYYAQAYALGMTGQPLFYDEIQAWKHGPVVPTVYRAYNRYERNPIQDVETVPIPDEDAALIRALIMDKGHLTASDLRSMTHGESPWKDAWAMWDGRGSRPVIPPEVMEEYFAPQFWGTDGEDGHQPVFGSPDEEKIYFLGQITDEESNTILTSR